MIYITGDCHGGFDRFENDKFSNLTKMNNFNRFHNMTLN